MDTWSLKFRQKYQEAILTDQGKKIGAFLKGRNKQVKPKVFAFFWMLMEEGWKFIWDGKYLVSYYLLNSSTCKKNKNTSQFKLFFLSVIAHIYLKMQRGVIISIL